jgi:signal transduction histidine kinase
MKSVLRSFLAAPRALGTSRLSRWDWILFLFFLAVGILDLYGGGYIASQPLAIGLAVLLSFTILWRRTHPLATVIVAFGAMNVVQLFSLFVDESSAGFSIIAILFILAYSLVRWGSGREAAIGLAFIFVHTVLSEASEWEGGSSVIFLSGLSLGIGIWVLAASFGLIVRHRNDAQQWRITQVRMEERQDLARELHDTVAHHISGIAIQAQAARVVAASQPESALKALEVIEKTASSTLAEMRKIVGALREVSTMPPRGLADIARLARGSKNRPKIDVRFSGKLDALDPSVETGLYRIAQESITNARRHARDANRITVRVEETDESVSLTVMDDGKNNLKDGPPSFGYGLTGMKERAILLGGQFQAGPDPEGGWIVRAVIPKTKGSS